MFRRILAGALAALALAPTARADGAPMVMIHSGYLLDGSDHPVTEPAQKLTFRIFDKSAPVADETKIWEASCTVNVSNGHYSVPLGGQDCGAGGLLPSHLPTNAARYLEVTVGTTVMLPRLLIGTVPTAAVAHDALKLEGQALADLDTRYAKFDAATPQAGNLAIQGNFAAAKVTAAGAIAGAGLSVSGKSSLGAVDATGDVMTTGALVGASAGIGGDGTFGGKLSAGSDGAIAGKLTVGSDASVAGALAVTGTVQAAGFAGSGLGLTNLDASKLSTGTVPPERIAGTIPNGVNFTSSQNRFTGQFTGTFSGSGSFTGDGAGLTGLNASNLTTGSIPDARIGANFARLDSQNAFTGPANYFKRVGVNFSGTNAALAVGPGQFIDIPSNGAAFVPDAYHRGSAGGLVMAGTAKADGTGWAYGSRMINHDYGNGLALSFDVLNDGTWTNDALVVSGRNGGVGNVGIGTAAPQAKLEVNGGIKTRGLGVLKVSRVAAGSSTAQIPIDTNYMAAHVGETFLYSDDGPDLQDLYDCSAANGGYRFADIETGWKGMYIVVIENATRLNVQWSGWEGQLFNSSGGAITAGMGRVNATLSFEGGFWKVQHMEGTVNTTNFTCY